MLLEQLLRWVLQGMQGDGRIVLGSRFTAWPRRLLQQLLPPGRLRLIRGRLPASPAALDLDHAPSLVQGARSARRQSFIATDNEHRRFLGRRTLAASDSGEREDASEDEPRRRRRAGKAHGATSFGLRLFALRWSRGVRGSGRRRRGVRWWRGRRIRRWRSRRGRGGRLVLRGLVGFHRPPLAFLLSEGGVHEARRDCNHDGGSDGLLSHGYS